MLGINIEATVRLAQAPSIPVIASWVAWPTCIDIERCAVESGRREGVICGQPSISGDLDFCWAAQAGADELTV